MLFLGLMLLPTKREMGNLFFKINDRENAANYLSKQFDHDKADISNTKRYLLVLIEEKNNVEVENIGNMFLASDPKNIEINTIMASYCEYNMFYSKAVKYWNTIFLENPTDAETTEKLLNYYDQIKNYDEMIKIYNYKIESGNAGLSDYLAICDLYFKQRDIKSVENICNEILKKYPKDKTVFTYLEYIYEYRGEKYQLQKLFEDRYNETNDRYFFERFVDIFIKAKEYSKAEIAFEKVLKAKPYDWEIRDYYLSFLNDTQNYQKFAYQSGLFFEKTKYIKYLKWQYESLYMLKDYENTILIIQKYHSKKGKDVYSYQILYEIYFDIKKDLYKARDVAYKLANDYNTDYENLETLGELFYENGDITSAMKILESYHEKSEGDYYSHSLLGNIYSSLGDSDRSKSEYETALEQLELQRKRAI